MGTPSVDVKIANEASYDRVCVWCHIKPLEGSGEATGATIEHQTLDLDRRREDAGEQQATATRNVTTLKDMEDFAAQRHQVSIEFETHHGFAQGHLRGYEISATKMCE